MVDPWTVTQEPAVLGTPGATVTLVEGTSFCLSDRAGDIRASTPHGFFLLDTRLLSTFELAINGTTIEALTASNDDPFSATFVGRLPSRDGTGNPTGTADTSSILVVRRRNIGQGLRDVIEIRNYGTAPVSLDVELRADADFADLFEVKESRVQRRGDHEHIAARRVLTFRHVHEGVTRGVRMSFSGFPDVATHAARWHVELEPDQTWAEAIEVVATIDTEEIEPRFHHRRQARTPLEELRQWRQSLPVIDTPDPALAITLATTFTDLGALRMVDPHDPTNVVVAAGAPWFMALFGRDALLTSWMALLVDPSLAGGVLRTLARLQGRDVVPDTEEQPGRILHEVRFGPASEPQFGRASVYYGSIDATPLFVCLLGELWRWTGDRALIDELLPAADKALEWVTAYGDRDGDGYIEYQRATPHGLQNQGWKDSWDGVRFGDGRMPEGPIALCEVQGYLYAALLARADLAADDAEAGEWRQRAAGLKEAFNRDFWSEEGGFYALGLDRDKKPIDAVASNMGHCLWTGIVDADRAAAVASHLTGTLMFNGWGIRTLSRDMEAYSPLSYHNGSVWPHDTAIAVAGLMRYGMVDAGQLVSVALLDAAAGSGGRLPELFSGLDRSDVSVPVPYPTSCSPQAWAAASPLLLLRSLLGFEPDVPNGVVGFDPAIPEDLGAIAIDGIRLGDHRISLEADTTTVHIRGLDQLRLVNGSDL